jgi:hypothetical protein
MVLLNLHEALAPSRYTWAPALFSSASAESHALPAPSYGALERHHIHTIVPSPDQLRSTGTVRAAAVTA